MEKRKDRIIAAIDAADLETTRALIDKLYPTIKIFKVGSQLFTSCGSEAVNMIRMKGAKIFLDLKFHDIPTIVAKAAAAATSKEIFMFNVHAIGGLDMMKKSIKASDEIADKLQVKRPLMTAVTVLTSMDKKNLKEVGINKEPEEQVLFLASLAKKAGMDGVVASADEITAIKKKLGEDFIVVTPGIRPEWAKKKDQQRTATPKEAFDRGADYIVIGRPIIEAQDPKAAAERVISEL